MAWMGHPTKVAMPGMATGAEVGALATALPGDVAFPRLMIRHHRGGVLMKRSLLARTERPEVVTPARAVVAAGRAEVAAMEQMLLVRGSRR